MAFNKDVAQKNIKGILEKVFKVEEIQEDPLTKDITYKEVTDESCYFTFQIPIYNTTCNFIAKFHLTKEHFNDKSEKFVEVFSEIVDEVNQRTKNISLVFTEKSLKITFEHKIKNTEDLEDTISQIISDLVNVAQNMLNEAKRRTAIADLMASKKSDEQLIKEFEQSNDDDDKIALAGLKAGFKTKFSFSNMTSAKLSEPHDFPNMKAIKYVENWEEPVIYIFEDRLKPEDMPKTWFDLWKILDEIVIESGDLRHIYLERLEPVDGEDGHYELSCGS